MTFNEDELRRLGFEPIGYKADDDDLVVEPPLPPAVPPVVVYCGRPKVFFLAVCVECNEGRRPIPMPFGTQADRDRWADGHRTTGHTVKEALEIRP